MTSVKTSTEFVCQDVADKKQILAPWLYTSELIMIYAPTGVGKSMFALSLAHALATAQNFLGWQTTLQRTVCYIEAEMSVDTTRSRFLAIENGSLISVDPLAFTIVSRDLTRNHLGNLSTPEGQAELNQIILAHDVIILDNLCSACPRVDQFDNDFKIWERLSKYLVGLRNLGKTFIMIHHSGKSGLQMGTSEREQVMDTIIKISRPVRPVNRDRLCMQIQFEKTRNRFPGQIYDTYAEYWVMDGAANWSATSLRSKLYADVKQMAHTVKNRATLSMIFHIPLIEVYDILKEPEPTTYVYQETDDDQF